jgi:hypothetical protein
MATNLFHPITWSHSSSDGETARCPLVRMSSGLQRTPGRVKCCEEGYTECVMVWACAQLSVSVSAGRTRSSACSLRLTDDASTYLHSRPTFRTTAVQVTFARVQHASQHCTNKCSAYTNAGRRYYVTPLQTCLTMA